MLVVESASRYERYVNAIQSQEGYQTPMAFALGVGTIERNESTDQLEVIDVTYLRRNYIDQAADDEIAKHIKESAAVMNHELGIGQYGLQTGGITLSDINNGTRKIDAILNASIYSTLPIIRSGDRQKMPNFDTLDKLKKRRYLGGTAVAGVSNDQVGILGVVRNWEDQPQTVADTYLRLYALSEGAVERDQVNLEGIDDILKSLVHTASYGVMTADAWNSRRPGLILNGKSTSIISASKKPLLLNHIIPKDFNVDDLEKLHLGDRVDNDSVVKLVI